MLTRKYEHQPSEVWNEFGKLDCSDLRKYNEDFNALLRQLSSVDLERARQVYIANFKPATLRQSLVQAAASRPYLTISEL